jgi:Toprim domain
MTTPDVRAFYTTLGIELPGWPKLEAPVRCFAQPDAHNHADRSPSCSVNLASGAWNCHGCGARGGAYDAALALGLLPRQAMDLLITNGLAEPRSHTPTRYRGTPAAKPATVVRAKPSRPRLAHADADVQSWAKDLDANCRLIRRLMLERAWSPRIMRALQIGFDGSRLTIPIRTARGNLRGVLRYDAFGRRDPKMRAAFGTRLGLIPHPAGEASNHIILVEGPSDMICARSAGLTAIAVPGTNAWHPAWSELLASRRVTIVMDCDAPGRRAAREIAASLDRTADAVEVVDLCPDREDGYDLTDRILECHQIRRCSGNSVRTVRALLASVQSPRHLSREPRTSNHRVEHRDHREE